MIKFKADSRVCFVGDSITANGLFIAHIADAYAKTFPESHVYMYGCGISGGSTRSARLYFNEYIMPFELTHAFIMLGVNDIGIVNYCKCPTAAQLEAREKSLDAYLEGMTELTGMLKSAGVTVNYITPPPYDEWQDCETAIYTGAGVGLTRCADIMRGLAAENGGEVIDILTPMTKMIHEMQLTDRKKSLCRIDRVHPNEDGQRMMAKLICGELGACDYSDALSDTAKVWLDYDSKLNLVYGTEWLLLQSLYGKSDGEKLDYIDSYLKEKKYPAPYYENIARIYQTDKKKQTALFCGLVRAACGLYQN